MKFDMGEQRKIEMKSFLLEHAELTKRWADAQERYLQLSSASIDLATRNKLDSVDVCIDLLKNLITATFTGLIALKVANPDWVTNDSLVITGIGWTLAISLLLLAGLLSTRYKIADRAAHLSKSLLDATDTLRKAESSCMAWTHKMHAEYAPSDHMKEPQKF